MCLMSSIHSVAVLGAGTMGAQIAAHFANTGLHVLLLDVTVELARDGLKRARALKPDPFFTSDTAALITTGGLDSDLHRVADVDWILEVVVEQIDIKRALVEKIEAVRRPGTIVTSNTSGIPIHAIAEGRGAEFRRHWLGTHFFNPPRYLPLGKGVVVAKDTPNFIANRIGLYGLIRILCTLEAGAFTIEDIDAITGPALGRPKSATFRTLDIAGLDVVGHVVRNLTTQLPPDEARQFALPPFVEKLIATGSIGEKSGQGFYKRQKTGGATEILTLDPGTLAYRPRQSSRLPALDAARSIEDVAERTKTLFLGRDNVGAFLRSTLGPLLLYTAQVAPDIAHSIDDVDRAMRWGFGWDLGPFEIWDAIGIREVLDATATAASDAPPLVADQL